jgi:peptidoglycan/LPS O-acetylase OafA/YrhL
MRVPTPEGATAPSERVPTLDGWRAVAVLLVIWHHFTGGLYQQEDAYYAGSRSQFGAFGVDIFFAISGLIITKLLVDEYRRSGGISFTGFYVRRAFRILPACFLYLTAVWLTHGIKTAPEFVASALFFRNYLPDPMGANATKHLWSLAVEEHFYLFWPLLLSTILVRRGLSKAASTIAWASIGCGLWRLIDSEYNLTIHWLPLVPVHFRTDQRLDALLWGCAVALFLSGSKQRTRLRKEFRAWMFWGVVMVAIACMALYSQLTSLWLAILIPLGLAATVLHPQWPVIRLLEHRWVRFIGRISYSLYLWQQLFLVPGWEHRSIFQTPPWNLPLTVALAVFSYHFLEKPCIAFGRRLSGRLQIRSTQSLCNPAVPVY